MAALNQCNFIGNLGRDLELRYTQSGTAVGNTSMAVTEKYNDQEKTEWVKLVFWGKAAEIVEKYAGKGSQMFVSGRMQTRQWDKDGVTHYTTEIHVKEFQFLGGNRQQGGQGQHSNQGGYQQGGQSQQNPQGQGGYQNQGQNQGGYQHNPDEYSPRPEPQQNYRQPQGQGPAPDSDIPF